MFIFLEKEEIFFPQIFGSEAAMEKKINFQLSSGGHTKSTSITKPSSY